jgi:hypothetical protein
VLAHFPANIRVERFRIAATQFADVANAQQIEVGGNRRPDARDARQVGNHGFGRRAAPDLPRGSVAERRGGAAFRVRQVEACGLIHVSKHTAS